MAQRSNTQDDRLQRLAMISQLIGKDETGGPQAQQPDMMDMLGKLYGINQEQQLLPYKEAELNSSANEANSHTNYYGQLGAALPDKAEATRERSVDHLTTALGMTQYLKSVGINIDPHGVLNAVQTGDFSQIMPSAQPQQPGNYADLTPGMPGVQGVPTPQPGGGILGQMMAQSAFNNRGGLPTPIPQQPNNFVTAFQPQRNQQRAY